MTYLANRPADFAAEATEGFVAAYPGWVRGVRGGVVRSTRSETPRVAVVIGGGSGHYPAFAGLVGQGLAAGAAMGNLFASPSAAQIVSVARAADEDAGVLFAYGNYAGDVLNFDQAQDQLRAAGVDCESVAVTDDISSAAVGESAKRRGVAGGLVIYKVAGAAAEEGLGLAEVAAVAARANDHTRTIGVAFSGCTLPGASEPLFTVPAGRMAVGMGVHGEPGISEEDLPTADGLAELLVTRLLGEVPAGVDRRGARVALILNGLGSIKSEELFVIYRRIAQLCEVEDLVIADTQIGEFVTSFEMAGVSLTICWLDPELERLWLAPASTPAFSRGRIDLADATTTPVAQSAPEDAEPTVIASAASREAAGAVVVAFERARAAIDDAVDLLGHLDSVAGDGDHGIGMQRGIGAACEAAALAHSRGAGIGGVLATAGESWADRAGGTSGAIWGVALRTAGESLGDRDVPDLATIATATQAARDAVQRFGKVSVGDKTMLDAIVPFVESLEESAHTRQPLVGALSTAAQAATAAAEATAGLEPRIGRARAHGVKSVGSPDPGAVSFALVVTAAAMTTETTEEGSSK